MRIITKPKNKLDAIFWDFDGVLMNSNEVRDQGFTEVLKEFPKEQVDQLMDFHHKNGGLSRYVKFRYFFEEIRKESISDEKIVKWAIKFSSIMREFLVNENLLILETLEFVKKNYKSIPMHIVSGSDQEELRYLCKEMKIDSYFKSIHGSPKPKTKWVRKLLKQYNYNSESCVLIGDSKNDYEAAISNQMEFMGYNNKEIETLSTIEFKLI